MPRYRLILEYDGRPFVGWQHQDERPLGMPGASEEYAIEKFSSLRVTVTGAGRTDAGVHAKDVRWRHISDLEKDLRPMRCATPSDDFLMPTARGGAGSGGGGG